MSRFQAKTNHVVEQELDFLREALGLRQNQKADLLRELASLAGWVIRQARQGRVIQARDEQDLQTLEHPVIEEIQRQDQQHASGSQLRLSDAEIARLAALLNEEFRPSASLQRSLQHIADPQRRPPQITWHGSEEGECPT